MLATTFRFGRAFLLPIVLLFILRILRLRQKRDQLRKIGVHVGELPNGVQHLIRKNLVTLLSTYHAEDGRFVRFICGSPLKVIYSLGGNAQVRAVLSKHASTDVMQDGKEVIKGLVRTAIREVRNWDQAPVPITCSVDELLMPVILDQVLGAGSDQKSHSPLLMDLLRGRGKPLLQPTSDLKSITRSVMFPGKSRAAPRMLEPRPQACKEIEQILNAAKLTAGDVDNSRATSLRLLDLFSLTSSITCWALVDLASHAAFQDDVVREIDTNIGRRMPPTLSEIRQLGALQQFVKESIRVHSPIPVDLCRVSKSFFVGDHCVPSGSDVLLAIFAANRDLEVFPDASEFDAGRPTKSEDFDSKVVWPPSDELSLAIDLAKTFLVVILQRYRVTLIQEPSGFLDGDDDDSFRNGFSFPNDNMTCRFEVRRPQPTL